MSDNHSWNHLGCYGDLVVRTPNIDRMAGQGIRFTNAYCAAPSSSPARAGMLTGQDIYRLEEGGNLWGNFPRGFEVYTDRLVQKGYNTGFQGKGWGPGSFKESGRESNPAGKPYNSFDEFISEQNTGEPWYFWLSTVDPHRPYDVGSGAASGLDISKVVVPPYLPNNDIVRGDICDYYHEVENFDKIVGQTINKLKSSGQYQNTVIIICSDNGWQMPRGLASNYDFGTRVPLIICWADKIKGSYVTDDFVSLNDLAPTFLELAGIEIPSYMTARSLLNILTAGKSGRIESERDFIVTARERHAFCRQYGLGYPCRALRTDDFLYIKNFEPDRWPAGDPPLFGDIDAHMLNYPSPTKLYMMINKDREDIKPLYAQAFMKRPAEELYDLGKDPWQLNNVADIPDYKEVKATMLKRLITYLEKTSDPRVTGNEIIWDKTEYFEVSDFKPRPSKESVDALGLQIEYDYLK